MIQEFRPDVAHVRNIYHHLSPSILWELKAQNVPVVYHLNDFKLLCPSYNLVSQGEACEACKGGAFWHALQPKCYPGMGARMTLTAEAYVHRWLRNIPEVCGPVPRTQPSLCATNSWSMGGTARSLKFSRIFSGLTNWLKTARDGSGAVLRPAFGGEGRRRSVARDAGGSSGVGWSLPATVHSAEHCKSWQVR